MANSNLYETEDFDKAEDFFNALRRINHRWVSKEDSWDSMWIFRGQQNATWKLIPHAFRSSALQNYKERVHTYVASLNVEPEKFEINNIQEYIPEALSTRANEASLQMELIIQVVSEMNAIEDFVKLANRVGHPVPGKAEVFLQEEVFFTPFEIVSERFYSLGNRGNYINLNDSSFALAQHHGVPTRLLDWTYNPLIAAFFAAEEVEPECSADERIAVWALTREAVWQGSRLSSVNLPRGEIRYLHAQEGVFIYDNAADRYFLHTGQWYSIDEILGEKASDWLRKLTLPSNQAGELLRLLWIEGISRAHLMPTYDNIIKALATRQKWNK